MRRKIQSQPEEKGPNMVVGLDIGTTKILMVMGLLREDGKIEVCGYGKVPSNGVEFGQVFNVQETINSILAAKKELLNKIDEPISSVYVGVAGRHIHSMSCTNSITRPNGLDKMVSKEEIDKMIAQMESYSVDSGDIITVIPQFYEVDGLPTLKPVGTLCQKVTGQYQLIVGNTLEVRKIRKSADGAGLDVRDLILEPMASGAVCLTEEEKNQGVALVDIGGGTSDLILYESGVPIYIKVIPVGGKLVTRDIQSLNLSFEQAEALKIKHGTCLVDKANRNNVFTIPDTAGYGSPTSINEYTLANVIQSRVKQDILEAIKREIDASGYASRIKNVVLTGGGAMIRDIKQLSEFVLQRRTRIGFPINGFSTTPDSDLKNPICATALGLLKMGCLAENQPYIGNKSTDDIVDSSTDDIQDVDDDSPKRAGKLSQLSKKLESWLRNILADGGGVE